MGFFGIGTWEILLILVLALIIWGPGKLPEIARTLGKTARVLRKASFDFTTAITKEIATTENDHPAPQPPENSTSKTEKTSPDISKPTARHQYDQPESPEEQQR